MNYQFGPFTSVTVLSNGTLRIYNSAAKEIVEINPETLMDIISVAMVKSEKASDLLEKALKLQDRYNSRVG